MLQQILRDMTIDPELLAELSEEQKQILFVKMREEQIRRYEEWAEEGDHKKANKPGKPSKPGHRNVNFLKGLDGQPWVWVMGDHKNDWTIEQILEEEAQAKALRQAEKEAEEIRKREDEETKRRIAEKKKRLEEEEKALRKKQQEEALYQSIKEARLAAEKLEEEKKKREAEDKLEDLRISDAELRRRTVEKMDRVKQRRSSEIYIQWKEMRHQLELSALKSSVEVDASWVEQEKKSKTAEKKMRELAQTAREEYRASLRRTKKLIDAAKMFGQNNSNTGSVKPPLPPKEHLIGVNNRLTQPRPSNRPPRPPNRAAVVEWFQQEERPRGVHLDATGKIAPWFHGIISRVEAEKLLENKGIGTFLVRVSERVWGYTISYKGDERIKHFLIDTSETGYQFFGASQMVHKTLSDLVTFHRDSPIAIKGNEMLEFPCRQAVEPPDYSELLGDVKSQVTFV
ncbi:SH2 domain-containing protein 4B-like [Gigantopelta aegis]|uniref:SH2 domain-containing protein 4B-like n=1 Tax=Gigantopelta aegis TaxID=1735272 RepID=UPI001B88C79D|nr:SH2 domain-containing protein 4B-like [Gigantopelta aegis]